VAACDGGTITSDGGALLLRELDRKRRIVREFAAYFTDHRTKDAHEFPLELLLAQRIFGIALRYEDVVDHDQLRADPFLATVVGATDPSGQQRRPARDRGKALTQRGTSTLDRLDLRMGDVAYDKDYEKIEVARLSCAERTLANAQALVVNQRVAAEAGDFVWRLVVARNLKRFVTYFDCASGSSRSLYCTPREVLHSVPDVAVRPKRLRRRVA